MRTVLAAVTIFSLLSSPTPTQQAPAAVSNIVTDGLYLSAADIAAAAARLPADRPSANTTFVEHKDASGTYFRLAVDRRRPPQNPAVHENEGEVWFVAEGSGTLMLGGKLVEPRKNNPTSTTWNGKAIEGGTAHQVSKGDVVVIPEGVPHYVTNASPNVTFVTFEIPRPQVHPY